MSTIKKKKGKDVEGMLMILSGCAAVGKNTVINTLLAEEGSRFGFMPTYTTRAPRPGEVEGFPYCYLTEEQFRQKIEEGELYEHEHIHTSYYGSSKKLLADALKTGKIIIKDIDVKGATNLKGLLSQDVKVVTVFLYIGKDEMERRLRGRGDSEEQIHIRLGRYEEEMTYAEKFDYRIENVVLEETVQKIKEIAEQEA